MSYITSFERFARAEGIEQGIQQGMQQGMQQGESLMLRSLLESKFCAIPEEYLQRIQQASPEVLLSWSKRLLHANAIEEIFDPKI